MKRNLIDCLFVELIAIFTVAVMLFSMSAVDFSYAAGEEEAASDSDKLSFSLGAELAEQETYQRKDGSLKVIFTVTPDNEEKYEEYQKDGWKFTFDVIDKASDKSIGYEEGKKVFRSPDGGYAGVCDAADRLRGRR